MPENLTPFGEKLEELAAKRGLTLEETIDLILESALEEGGVGHALEVYEEMLEWVYWDP